MLPPPTGCFLDSLLPTEHTDWHLIHTVNTNIKSGVVALTLKTRKCYWMQWINFLPTNIDPELQNVDPQTRVLLLQLFAQRARQGHFGRGCQVKTGSVQAALGAVAKTIELAGRDNPLHRPRTTNYYAALALQMETYRQADPTTNKQHAVPVAVPNHVFLSSRRTFDR